MPPLSPYGTLHGSLFQYSQNLVAFESSPQEKMCKNKCILLGGLSDGLLPTPYTPKLEQACHAIGWSLVQPILSSSYLGFGNGDLDRDTEELRCVCVYVRLGALEMLPTFLVSHQLRMCHFPYVYSIFQCTLVVSYLPSIR